MVKSFEDVLKAVILSIITTIFFGVYVIWKQRQRKLTYKIPLPYKWRAVGEISKIIIYPMTNCKHKELNIANCTTMGLCEKNIPGKLSVRDRSFIVFNESKNERVFAEDYPKISSINVHAVDENTVVFSCPGYSDLQVKLPRNSKSTINTNFAKMWYKTKSQAVDCGKSASDWLSKILDLKDNIRCRLLYYITPNQSSGTSYIRQLGDSKRADDFSVPYLISEDDTNIINSDCDFNPNIIVKSKYKFFNTNDWKWMMIGDSAVLRREMERTSFETFETKLIDPIQSKSQRMRLVRQGEIKVGYPVFVDCK